MQQSQVSGKNYVYFLLSVVIITLAYPRIRNHFFPPPPAPEKVWAHDRVHPLEQLEVGSRLIQTATGRGLADAVDVAAQYIREPVQPQRPRPKWDYEFENPKEQNSIIARMVLAAGGGPVDPALITQAYVLNSRVIAKHADLGRPAEQIALGGDGFQITAALTQRGGGVSELLLNEFPAADWYGLPEKDAKGKAKPVALIPRIEGADPAFAVYHYSTADDKEPRPVDTLAHAIWAIDHKVTDGNRHEVTFSTELPSLGVRMFKTFSLAKGDYHLGLRIRVEKLSGGSGGKFRYQLAGTRGLPIEGGWYATTYRNSHVGLVDDRDVTYRLSADAMTLDRSGGSDRYRKDNKRIVYAATVVQYFASAIAVDNLNADGAALPLDKQAFLQFARVTVEDKVKDKPYLDDITARVIPEAIELGEPTEHRYLLYHGPVKVRQLSRLKGDRAVDPGLVDRYADALKLSSLTDYGGFGWWSDAIIKFTNLVHWLLQYLHAWLPGGLAIICVTIIVRGAMFPLSRKQALNMQVMQEKMAKLGPEMKEIEAKFRDDFLGKQQAQRELYRKHNVNPAAGLSGCLMLVLQMPIFMGLYYALQESVFFRLEPFLWIRNLAAPDMLAWWGENIPGISVPGSMFYLGPYFNILPIIGASLIFIQQKKSMPAEMTDEQRQQYGMMKIMTGLMAFMFYKVPAGLSLYFIASSIWGLTERYVVKKHLEASKAEREAVKPGSNGKPSKGKTPIKPPSKLAAWWEKLLRDASKK